MNLTRDAIIATAVDLLDNYGLADMTMRRVATTLGVAPGALYWHVANKQALIAAIAENFLAPVVLSTNTPAPTDLAVAVRTILMQHRDGAELVSAALSQPDSPLWEVVLQRAATAMGGTLGSGEEKDAGTIRVAAEALVHLALGTTLMEQSAQQFAEATGAAAPADGEENLVRSVTMLTDGLKSISSQ